jgi:TRAP-type uncharacterized transport system substrate-binding protein
MKANKTFLAIAVVAMLAVQLFTANTLFAEQERTQVVSLSTPFGTSGYVANSALEQVFKKAGSWVDFQIKETPGAMYMAKYFYQNKAAMVNGEIPQLTVNTSTGILGHVNDPRPPFQGFKGGMDQRAVFSTHTALVLFTTFDSSIKDLKALAGKKVGVNEKPRIFTGTLLHKPYFEKGLKIWDKVDWQMIGKVNSKNAMLNNQIDVHSSTLSGQLEIQEDGTLVCRKVAPATATMELLNSGKKLHYIDTDPEIIKQSYDFDIDMRVYPVLIKKGAHESIDRDIWARAVMGIYVVHESMPDEVVKEIIRVRYQHHSELAKFHAALGLWPENPFPIGVPDKWLHPGVKKAMQEFNIPMP